jgi:hypothetical protein
MIRTNRPIASSLAATTDSAIEVSNTKTYFALVECTIPPARWIQFHWSAGSIPLASTSKHSATDDLGRGRRGGHSRQFDREDAAFTRRVASMNVAAQCFDGAGDDGQAQPRPGTLSGAASERHK